MKKFFAITPNVDLAWYPSGVTHLRATMHPGTSEVLTHQPSRSWPKFALLERALILWLFAIAVISLAGCSTTQFFEREKLNDRAAQFDQDGGLNYLRQKIEAAREGSLGGFGSAEAGGCGCQ